MRTLVYNSTRVCNKTTVIQNESTDSCNHIYSLTILAIDKASVAFHQVCPLRESNMFTNDPLGQDAVSTGRGFSNKTRSRVRWRETPMKSTTGQLAPRCVHSSLMVPTGSGEFGR